MSVIAEYNPMGVATAGNSLIAVVPLIADLNAPTVIEANAGVAFQCAIEEFGSATTVSYTTRRKLCDKKGRQRIGERNYTEIQLTPVLDDPQSPTQELVDLFAEDQPVYLLHRPGKDHQEALAAADMVQAIKGVVALVDLTPITTENGEEYTATISIAVDDRNDGMLVPLA